jgi:hypothetical protein
MGKPQERLFFYDTPIHEAQYAIIAAQHLAQSGYP